VSGPASRGSPAARRQCTAHIPPPRRCSFSVRNIILRSIIGFKRFHSTKKNHTKFSVSVRNIIEKFIIGFKLFNLTEKFQNK
jgi:hypothetical protein